MFVYVQYVLENVNKGSHILWRRYQTKSKCTQKHNVSMSIQKYSKVSHLYA